MAVNHVNLCADLQAWHSAGLSFLYFEGLDAAGLLRDASLGRAALRRAPGAEPLAQAPAAVQAGSAQGRVKGPAGAVTAPAQGETRPAQKKAADGKSAPARPLPAAWQALQPKLRPAPVVWTYRELGEDLMLTGNPERSKALRELIGSLGLKAGTSSFLPTVLPGGAQDGSEAWCFESLLDTLGGRILVALGPEALALGPYGSFGLEPFQEKLIPRRMLLCLPSFSDILANQARFEATKVFLRAAFNKITIL